MNTFLLSLRPFLLILGLLAALVVVSPADDEEDWEEEDGEIHLTVSEIETFLQDHLPGHAQRLAKAKKEGVQAYVRGLEEAGERIAEYLRVKDEEPEMAARMLNQAGIELEIDELSEQWHDAEEAARAPIEAKLRTSLESMFEIEHELARLELEHMKAEVEAIEAELAEEAEAREGFIEDALHELLHQHDDDDEEDEEEYDDDDDDEFDEDEEDEEEFDDE